MITQNKIEETVALIPNLTPKQAKKIMLQYKDYIDQKRLSQIQEKVNGIIKLINELDSDDSKKTAYRLIEEAMNKNG